MGSFSALRDHHLVFLFFFHPSKEVWIKLLFYQEDINEHILQQAQNHGLINAPFYGDGGLVCMITNCLKEAARLVDVKIEIECEKK